MSDKMSTYKHTFEWPSKDANEVYVTGTFDNWSKTIQLNKSNNGGFSKTVELSLPKNIKKLSYKFVVDNNWLISSNDKIEHDDSGIENNVLYITDDDLIPISNDISELDGSSEFTSISYPTDDDHEFGGLVDVVPVGGGGGDTEDVSSSTQITLKDDQSAINETLITSTNNNNNLRASGRFGVKGSSSSNNNTNGIFSKLRSFFK